MFKQLLKFDNIFGKFYGIYRLWYLVQYKGCDVQCKRSIAYIKGVLYSYYAKIHHVCNTPFVLYNIPFVLYITHFSSYRVPVPTTRIEFPKNFHFYSLYQLSSNFLQGRWNKNWWDWRFKRLNCKLSLDWFFKINARII